MVFDDAKPLKNIEKKNMLFSVIHKDDEKTMPKGTSQFFGVQNGDVGLPGSTYPLI